MSKSVFLFVVFGCLSFGAIGCQEPVKTSAFDTGMNSEFAGRKQYQQTVGRRAFTITPGCGRMSEWSSFDLLLELFDAGSTEKSVPVTLDIRARPSSSTVDQLTCTIKASLESNNGAGRSAAVIRNVLQNAGAGKRNFLIKGEYSIDITCHLSPTESIRFLQIPLVIVNVVD